MTRMEISLDTEQSQHEEQPIEVIRGFLRTRDIYYRNAQELIGRGELRKASEMLWGAVTQSVKALAAVSNVRVTTHNQFFDFLRQLCDELEDDYFFSSFIDLNNLHRNFYDECIPSDAFYIYHRRAFQFIERIEEFLREREQEMCARELQE